MRVFVTGAGGFVGRRLLPSLDQMGHEAIGADREVDVTDESAIQRAFEKASPDAIIHLAALSSVAESWRRAEECFHLNFVGTRNVLRAMQDVAPAARLLLISSADVYAATRPQTEPFDEKTPLRPRSPYARSKAAAELLGARAAARGLDVVRVRAFNHTGAGQADTFVASSFARQVAAIANGQEKAEMQVGNLASVRDFLHVDDVIRAYEALLDPGVPADVYNVASERATSIQDVLDLLTARAGIAPRVERDPDRYRPTDWLVGSAAKLRNATGWAPRIPLEALLEELYLDWSERDRR